MSQIELILLTNVTALCVSMLSQWFALRARVQIERGQKFEQVSQAHAEAIVGIRTTLAHLDKRTDEIYSEQIRQRAMLHDLAKRPEVTIDAA